jgi:ABC-type branched-subunit amino acid transport system permease subunit
LEEWEVLRDQFWIYYFWVIISETDRLAYIFFENANGQQLAGVRFLLVGLLIMLLMIFRPSGLLGKERGAITRCQIIF